MSCVTLYRRRYAMPSLRCCSLVAIQLGWRSPFRGPAFRWRAVTMGVKMRRDHPIPIRSLESVDGALNRWTLKRDAGIRRA